jgi:type VI secretion system protein ImpF
VETAIATHEPRFQNVIVTEGQAQDREAREVRFLIQATLRMDPSPEVVYFDTVLDLSSREYEVKGE